MTVRPGGGDGGGGYLHHALFYDSPQALVDAARPFLRAGLPAGDLYYIRRSSYPFIGSAR
jgi:hypothetical protein